MATITIPKIPVANMVETNLQTMDMMDLHLYEKYRFHIFGHMKFPIFEASSGGGYDGASKPSHRGHRPGSGSRHKSKSHNQEAYGSDQQYLWIH
ncbi:hypothetical protein WR25_14531 [Diploscapter pachys]|uniref:Uncharacterized protein n=1 Tax=Diploscapter pachys TaxID=2018661 RepID=A0A2A2JU69_9BILA|nr:hypothetical protein WR25_14531 [Diploscapter pachys]